MSLSGRIVEQFKSLVLPPELAIIDIHRRAFAPGVESMPTSRVLLSLLRVVLQTALRRTPPVDISDDTRGLIEKLRNGPALALTGHLGNWEYIARFGTRDRFKLSVIARPARIKFVQKLLERARGDLNVVWRTGSSLKAAAEIFKKGAWLGALVDQDLDARGERVLGFGLRAHTPSSLVELAISNHAAIIAAFMMREKNGRYRLIVEQLDSEAGTHSVLTQFQSCMQRVVEQYPEQWVWFHKRWRTTQRERISGKRYVAHISSLLPLGDPFIIVHPSRIDASSKS